MFKWRACMLNINSVFTLNNKQKMPLLGLGVWQIPSGHATEQAVRWALQAGYRHIDTARFYKNEASVGKAIRSSGISREKIWVTTKIWPTDFYRAQKIFDESLNRLGLDYIDLYLIHWPIPGLEKRNWKIMENIYERGSVKAIGVSNHSISQLKKILSIAHIPPAVNQVKCSPFNFKPEMHEFCDNNSIALEAYSPLTRGKKLGDKQVAGIAKKYKKSPSQILIRWALQKQIIVIPKSDKEQHIIENSKVYDFEIQKDDVLMLDNLAK